MRSLKDCVRRVGSREVVGSPRGACSLKDRKELWKGTGAPDLAGVRNLQSQPLGRGGPLPPGITPAPDCGAGATQPAFALLALQLLLRLGRDSRQRGELNPAPQAARHPSRPFRGSGEPPPLPASPVPAVSRLRRDGGAQALVCLGFGELGSQGSSKGQRSHQPHRPKTPQG